jgi:hypothetical protein
MRLNDVFDNLGAKLKGRQTHGLHRLNDASREKPGCKMDSTFLILFGGLVLTILFISYYLIPISL